MEKHNQSVGATRRVDSAAHLETGGRQDGHWREERVRIQLMTEHLAKPGVIVRNVYFCGGGVFRVHRGRFRFVLDGRDPIVIRGREILVVYPNQRVTIEALDKVNLFVYVLFEGLDVAAYFDSFGFFNGIHGVTGTQIELFREVKSRFETDDAGDRSRLMTWFSYALTTYAHDLKVGVNVLVGEAIRQIRENLKGRIVRLTPLYEQLQVGHTALSQAFRQAGIGLTPAEFIRQEQVRLVSHLLKNTRKPIAEIAAETGFISATHFANFIRRNLGMSAREVRRGGKIVKLKRQS